MSAPLATVTTTIVAETTGPTRLRHDGFVRRLVRQPACALALVFLALLVSAAVFAPLLAPYDPSATDVLAIFQGPSSDHWFGTDQLGRDQLSRLLFGARTSLVASVQAVAVSLLLGVPLGAVAGYVGGTLDTLLSRFVDALMSVPGLVLALAIIAALGPGLTNAMLALGVIFVPRVFRVVRAASLEVKRTTFVEAAESIGCTRPGIMVQHILPHCLTSVLVVAAISLGTAVLAEASLSFLGLGAQPPTSSWGGMLALASTRLDLKYLLIPAGVALSLTIAAFTTLSDGLDRALSGRTERRAV